MINEYKLLINEALSMVLWWFMMGTVWKKQLDEAAVHGRAIFALA